VVCQGRQYCAVPLEFLSASFSTYCVPPVGMCVNCHRHSPRPCFQIVALTLSSLHFPGGMTESVNDTNADDRSQFFSETDTFTRTLKCSIVMLHTSAITVHKELTDLEILPSPPVTTWKPTCNNVDGHSAYHPLSFCSSFWVKHSASLSTSDLAEFNEPGVLEQDTARPRLRAQHTPTALFVWVLPFLKKTCSHSPM